ncbi:hypothetical protein JW756_05530 [Candidatus Woesearchaeota archaeon]|nr:hypothetical protein [Candidatus Woesearchaeota archaeon]
MKVSTELKEIVKAWLAISIAFGIIIMKDGKTFGFSFLIAALTVGLGFLVHELSHRHYARKFHKYSEFRANNMMLVIAIIMSFLFNIIIAVPGAVIISGFVHRKEAGIIATAGPASNMALAIIFLPLMLIIPTIAFYGFMINSWLALFNLMPFLGFDGRKILDWSKPAYFMLLGIAILMNVLHVILPNIMSI